MTAAAQGPARRDVLVGAGVAGLAVASLAACGSADSSGEAPKEPVTVPADKVSPTQGYVDRDKKIVVTQPAAGEYHAFTATCPHQGCLVTEVNDGSILCPCHSSRFTQTDGSVVSGPAKSGLTKLNVKRDGSNLVVGG